MATLPLTRWRTCTYLICVTIWVRCHNTLYIHSHCAGPQDAVLLLGNFRCLINVEIRLRQFEFRAGCWDSVGASAAAHGADLRLVCRMGAAQCASPRWHRNCLLCSCWWLCVCTCVSMLLIMHEEKSVFRLFGPKGRSASQFSLTLLVLLCQPEFYKKCGATIP